MTDEPIYKVGDWLYINEDDDFDDHIVGGRAKISSIYYDTGLKLTMLKLKGFPPAYSFPVRSSLFDNQAELRRRYGRQKAKVLEDVNGGM